MKFLVNTIQSGYFYGLLIGGLVIGTVSCTEDGERGGSHGDMDMAQETSFDDTLDVPPYISDPMQIEEGLKAQPNSPYFGWTHLNTTRAEEGWGHAFYARKSGNFEVRVTLANLEAQQILSLAINDVPCLKSESLNTDKLKVLGKVEMDRQGRGWSEKITFAANDTPENIVMTRCHEEQYFTWILSQSQAVSCGPLKCLERNLENAH